MKLPKNIKEPPKIFIGQKCKVYTQIKDEDGKDTLAKVKVVEMYKNFFVVEVEGRRGTYKECFKYTDPLNDEIFLKGE